MVSIYYYMYLPIIGAKDFTLETGKVPRILLSMDIQVF